MGFSDSIIQIGSTVFVAYYILNKLLRSMIKNKGIFLIFLLVACQSSKLKTFRPTLQNEGDGAKVIRIIGSQYLRRLDPFLMLDYFHVRLPAGFPAHPHRGFQTVTYMKKGVFYHQDFKGHKGKIEEGDVQWMTAGKGIVHSEMPGSFDEDSVGFQLWLNLKGDKKMQQPRYQQFKSNKIKTLQINGTKIILICGEIMNEVGPIQQNTPAYFLDVQINKDSHFQINIEEHWNSLIYVYDGNISHQTNQQITQISNLTAYILPKSSQSHKLSTQSPSKLILVSGQPVNQRIAQYGPFVMSTEQEIRQAFEDYRQSKNGFEGAMSWINQNKDRNQYEQL